MRQLTCHLVYAITLLAMCGCTPVKSFVGTKALVPESRSLERAMDHLPVQSEVDRTLSPPDPPLLQVAP